MAPVRLSCPMFCKQRLCTVMWQLRSLTALHICVTRSSPEYRLLLFCKYLNVCKLQLKFPGYCCIEATLQQHHGYVMGGYILTAAPAAASSGREAVLWLPCQPEEFLRLLKSSNIVTHILPTLGSASSADSVNSKTTGVTNRISSTPMKIHLLTQLSFHHGLTEVVNLVASGLEIWYRM